MVQCLHDEVIITKHVHKQYETAEIHLHKVCPLTFLATSDNGDAVRTQV